MNALVTIGICVKNNEDTIDKAMNSIINQNYPNKLIELIIVDGYSKDNTIKNIKRILSNTNIKYKFYFESVGLGYARQIVVDHSTGKYILWVDGDMILTPNYLTSLVTYMENNQKVGIAKGRYGIYNKNNLVGLLEDVEFVLNYKNLNQITSKVIATSGSIYRVKAIREIGGFDINIKGVGEDIDAEYRIRNKGWLTYIISALFYEQRRTSWKELWKEYYWHGKGGLYLLNKNRKIIQSKKFFFPLLIFSSITRIPEAYLLTHKKEVLLLPFHYAYKRLAWMSGLLSEYCSRAVYARFN